MINQLRTALWLAGEGQVEQGERLVMRVGERIVGMVERGQMDPGLADALLEIVDAIVAEEDVCAPTVLEGDAIVTDATLLGWSTSPVTHVTGSVIIDGLTATDIDVLPRLERVDGGVRVTSNVFLVALYAFDRLTRVGGTVQTFRNTSLTALPLFPELASAGTVDLRAGPVMQRIEGFNALTTIEEHLVIRTDGLGSTVVVDGFYALTTLGFPVLPTFGVTYLCPSLQAIESEEFDPPACVEPD
jgi:hypothetical protein